MKKCVAVLVATVLAVWTAAAEDVPKIGTYLGYEYVRFNSATNVPAFSANGGGGQFIYNFNRWISGVVDLGAVHNGNIHNLQLDSTVANALAGPPRRWARRCRVLRPTFRFCSVSLCTTSAAPLTDVVLPPGRALPTGSFLRATRPRSVCMTAGGGLT
jgi:hypothetical protein